MTEDEDRNFLLSLVKDLKYVPTEYRLDAKLEIISVLRKYTRMGPAAPS
jgi:hypothetical protein